MSVKHYHSDVTLGLAIMCGLCGYSGVAMAENAEQPDMEFLEYLGSWEASDEDWVLLAADVEEETQRESENSDSEPQAEKVAEVDDE